MDHRSVPCHIKFLFRLVVTVRTLEASVQWHGDANTLPSPQMGHSFHNRRVPKTLDPGSHLGVGVGERWWIGDAFAFIGVEGTGFRPLLSSSSSRRLVD